MAIVPPFGASITLKGTNPSSLTMGIRNSFSKFTNLFKRRERSDAVLKSGIAKFYDESSGIWLDVWGGMLQRQASFHCHQAMPIFS